MTAPQACDVAAALGLEPNRRCCALSNGIQRQTSRPLMRRVQPEAARAVTLAEAAHSSRSHSSSTSPQCWYVLCRWFGINATIGA